MSSNLTSLAILALQGFVMNRYGLSTEGAARLLQESCEAQIDIWAQMALAATTAVASSAKDATASPAKKAAAAPIAPAKPAASSAKDATASPAEKPTTAAPAAPAKPAASSAKDATASGVKKNGQFSPVKYLRDVALKGKKEVTLASAKRTIAGKSHGELKAAVEAFAAKQQCTYDEALKGLIGKAGITLK